MSAESQQTLEGVLERVVYQNAETAWSVVRVDTADPPGGVTAVGNLLGVQPGESLRLSGQWVQDKKYGRQFKVDSYLTIAPNTLVGIERYLGSGLVEGIGEQMAKRLVAHFKMETLNVVEQAPERLTEVDGIGPIRAKRISEAWVEQKAIKDVMIFLQAHGVSTAYAIRIYKRYGNRAMALVRENPYRLALEVAGIGFRSADRIAASMGIAQDSPRRAEAGVLHALGELADDGHVCAPRSLLVEQARSLLEVNDQIIHDAVSSLGNAGLLEIEPWDGEDAIYLPALHQAEVDAAKDMVRIVQGQPRPTSIDVDRAIEWFERSAGVQLARAQRQAVARATDAKLLIITGGPGTGKTTIVNGIIRILEKKGHRILLAAPTGRAAKRMSEATQREAKTLHRLLEFVPKDQIFAKNEETPLEADMVIVDEVSMVDVVLLRHLLAAVPDTCRLVLVGDIDQLPSVGPGQVLGDVIDAEIGSVVRLTQIFRQAEESLIVVNAHRVNAGEAPRLAPGPDEDFYLIEREEPEDVLATIKTLLKERIPKRFGLDPLRDVQVLTPMHRGSLGAANLNRELQDLLNPSGTALTRGQQRFRVGDKVMQIRNNYDLGVFNGDIGRVSQVQPDDGNGGEQDKPGLWVRFDEEDRRYELADLDELTLAYACSVHKSQGSEYAAVIVPVSTQHYVMLRRNLLYTAVTRGKRLVVLVGSQRALALAIQRHQVQARHTHLAQRLRGG